jgi:hypothetical protein
MPGGNIDGLIGRWAGSALAAVAALVACSDGPLEPAAPGWVTAAYFPSESRYVNAVSAEYGVYAVAGSDSYQCNSIIKLSEGAWEADYTAPENVGLHDIKVSYDTDSYAVGVISGPHYSYRPYILWRPAEGNGWAKLDVPNLPDGAALQVAGAADGGGWLVISNEYYEPSGGVRPGILAKFSGTSSRVFYALGNVTFAYSPRPPWPGIAFAVEYPGYHGFYGSGGGRVFVSLDGGASWTEERLPPNAARGRVIKSAFAAAIDGRELYLVADLGGGATGVIRRTGAPGAGYYEPVFISPVSPYFMNVAALAFREMATASRPGEPYGVSCDAVAVGEQTAVVVNDGLWRLERLAVPTEFYGVVPRRGNGFVAWGVDLGMGGTKLFYHP